MASLLTLKILEGYDHPVFSLPVSLCAAIEEGGNVDRVDAISCLVDTGANIPVWTRGSDMLLRYYQAVPIKGKQFILSGFGKVAEMVAAYRITDFSMEGDDGDKIVFKSLTIACTERPAMVANLILPATAFNHMNYTVRNVGVETPVVEIEHDREEYAISPVYSKLNTEIIERVYSFSNE